MVNLNLNVIYFTDKSVNCGHISGANSFELAFAVPNRRDLMLKKNSLILLVPETSFWNADVMLSLEKLIQMLVWQKTPLSRSYSVVPIYTYLHSELPT